VVGLNLAIIDLDVGDIRETRHSIEERSIHRPPAGATQGTEHRPQRALRLCTAPSATLSHQPEVGELTSLECRFVIFPYGFVG